MNFFGVPITIFTSPPLNSLILYSYFLLVNADAVNLKLRRLSSEDNSTQKLLMARSTKSPAKAAKGKVIKLKKDDAVIDKKQTVLQQAAAAQKNNDLELAEALYKKQLHEKAFNPALYKKLMVLYRKEKRYKDELDIINKALKHFEEQRADRSSQRKISAGIRRISNSLNKSLGLTTKSGKEVYEPSPIPEWRKRKENVQKKLKLKKK